MALTPFESRILLDTGISMGDEGKGRLIPELIRELVTQTRTPDPVGVVVKVNGGANAGHTSGGLKLNLFPAGVVERSVGCLAVGSGVVADPHKFIWESAYIEHNGYDVRSRLLIDQRTMVSDLSHRLLDLGWEWYRVNVLGQEKRGSTGRGISPSYSDETAHFPVYYYEFLLDRETFSARIRARMDRALRTLQHVCRVPEEELSLFFDTLTAAETRANRGLIDAGLFKESDFDFSRFRGETPYSVDMEELVEAYWSAGQTLREQIGDVREKLHETLAAGKYIIGEFGQAFWLDKRFGFPPNVTASHTLPAEFFLSSGMPLQPAHTLGVCKAYDTKVGTHIFLCQFPEDHPLGKKLSKLEYGTTTGRQRMVGWYDAVEKGDAIRYGGCTDININKIDALSYEGDWLPGGELLICTGYRKPDGSVIKHVPRDMETHRSLKPVYIQVPGWEEDISKVRTFDNLPLNAKRYVAAMVKATLEVAIGDLEKTQADLPNLRYLGVGPDPDQIIRDIPATRDLIKLA
ncbi:adenylosuccinate synthase [Puniceicoccales bacterium CK1056]|uniref:Adenylosuccinate synthetase n=1 Tax=Oceanipulchritudo coccoides TaxID=2706888 RepID=A0A6B2M2S4_9BACT|nr:adenylosuccinate synthetase [Oceanipulchritudo coccoides]NDV62696.1 adenylosuccinate synthase [Oceanipulchritudo coccoides]